ncbi:BZ3500_MvSof-1268-A1-R1_Chr3-1g06019 [Microbotryum saponariae]|uniref:BZ3500_MvSof-1268-A1-R1_Chr3-1g06019 protein n=1 Tax=Microbotryum saponariae TaxID=289078 RepID=A0A2X0LHE9_9BASI|nr:BZ3500_MvSof-1268-A1-R1_Chr3-1g06019 [Microbotryum saponariae]SDA05209.1 BZ3501_MvSof-1269-A2-R1_Chr3-1g05689 [Microbotryum saponariae]
MRSVLALAVLALAAISPAAAGTTDSKERMTQITKRSTKVTDIEIMNFALTLEHLEKNFFFTGLAKYKVEDFVKAGYTKKLHNRIQTIGIQEKDHVIALASGLGKNAVSPCQYDFGGALASVDSFVHMSRVLETVGTAAYLGATPKFSTPAAVGASGSILTIEARHSSLLNEVEGQSGFPAPFETALEFNQVWSLASPMIKPGTCGAKKPLPPGLKAYPVLNVVTKVPRRGHQIAVKFAQKAGGKAYAVFLFSGVQTVVSVKHGSDGISRIDVPSGFQGATYLFISSSKAGLTDASTVAGPALLFL